MRLINIQHKTDYKSTISHINDIYDLISELIYMKINHTDLMNNTCRVIEDILLDVFNIHTEVICDNTSNIPKFIIPDDVIKYIHKNFPEYTL